MRHPYHLPTSNAVKADPTPPPPPKRPCAELGICQGDGRCPDCDQQGLRIDVPSQGQQFGHAIIICVLVGVSAGVAYGALRELLSWAGS